MPQRDERPEQEQDAAPTLIECESILSARTHQGRVNVRLEQPGKPAIELQLPTRKAREVAGLLLEAAEAADSDAMLFTFMTGANLGEREALAMLMQFRSLRLRKRQHEDEMNARDQQTWQKRAKRP